MAYLIFILISLLLLAGFFVLTEYEGRRGSRFAPAQRARLDGYVERATFVLTHVDFKAFFRDIARQVARRVAHDSAHVSLLVVRAIERVLTRTVRRLRAEQITGTQPRESNREFVKTLSDFKDQLRETPPEIPDILEK